MVMDTPSKGLDEYARTVAAISAALNQDNLKRAYEIANWAINRGIEGRVIYNARALAYQASGRYNEAIIDFRKALKYSPNDYAIYNAIGTTLDAQDRAREAVEAFDAALAIKPDEADTHYRRGQALARLEEQEEAEVAYERVLAINPDHVAALASIASIAGRKGDFAKTRHYADMALALNPADPTAHYAVALVEMGEHQYQQAELRLRQIVFQPGIHPEMRGVMYSLLGDSIDAQKRYAEAFEVYARGNELLRRDHAADYEDGRVADTAHHLTTYFKTASADRWKPADSGESLPDGPSEHVFLLGFMRSGTTLLEQVLASNEKVVALEEKRTITNFSNYLGSIPDLESLADIHGDDLKRMRAAYWEHVREYAPDIKGKILVDKQPLNTVRMPLIAKLFPKAKILFAIRDPRDVVFSCYRRPFSVTVTMFEFLGLEDAASFYAGIMGLAKLYREKLTLNLMDHYYEDMVTDFEPRVRAVCDFIGLEWSDSMRDFNKNAPQININSPSARQVKRPLYGEGIGQWRNYAEQLRPIMPILRPWIEEFGYSVE